MFVYTPHETNFLQFVAAWSAAYRYEDDHLYSRNIGQPLTAESIRELFRWKNGRPLSARKQASVEANFVGRRAELQQIERGSPVLDLLNRFESGGAIWRIFWLHCWQRDRFPIYDQHVHRAMTYLRFGIAQEIPSGSPAKTESYVNQYLPFYVGLDHPDGRAVDKALWAFGKYLSNPIFPLLAETDA